MGRIELTAENKTELTFLCIRHERGLIGNRISRELADSMECKKGLVKDGGRDSSFEARVRNF